MESPDAIRNDVLAAPAEVRLDPAEVTAIAEGGQVEQPRDLQSRRVRILMAGRRYASRSGRCPGLRLLEWAA